ncbi:MAG TPA: hypothetical protein VFT85_01670 [Acidimicrobiia bacterium]|nr:hypothetical protein [Acidimicrobiia bacterium]
MSESLPIVRWAGDGVLERHDSIVRRALPILVIVVAGCVAGADGPSPTDPHGLTTTTTLAETTVPLSPEESLAGYRECLANEGVDVSEIPLDALGRPRMADALKHLDLTERSVLDALEICGAELESGALALGDDPEMTELVQGALQNLVVCMRARGVEEFPEPVADFDGVGSPFPVNRIPWTDPDLPRAVLVCSDLP